jgi:hypothetical protein
MISAFLFFQDDDVDREAGYSESQEERDRTQLYQAPSHCFEVRLEAEVSEKI